MFPSSIHNYTSDNYSGLNLQVDMLTYHSANFNGSKTLEDSKDLSF